MSPEAELSMLSYFNLRNREKNKLKKIEGALWQTLHEKGVTARPYWTSRYREDVRIVYLCLPERQEHKVIFELTEEDLAHVQPEDILSKVLH